MMSRKGGKDKETSSQQGHVVGLSNLGSTCFFNALLQCLHHAYDLHDSLQELMTRQFQYHIHLDKMDQLVMASTAPTGSITYALQSLLNTMSGNCNRTSPQALFNEIIERAPQFRGYQQQDSQEVMHYLLDGVRDEEVKRLKTIIIRTLKATAANNVKVKDLLTDDDKKRIREFVQDTVIDRIFGGKVVNTITCQECHQTSQRFDSFLDLSLPMAEQKSFGSRNSKNQTSKNEFKKKLDVEDKYGIKNDNKKKSNFQKKKERKLNRRAHKKSKKGKKMNIYELGKLEESKSDAQEDNKLVNNDTVDGSNDDNVKIDQVICTEFKDTVVINKKTQSSIGLNDGITNNNDEVKIKVDSNSRHETESDNEKNCDSNSSDISNEEVSKEQESDKEDANTDDVTLNSSQDEIESESYDQTNDSCDELDDARKDHYVCPERLSSLSEAHDQYTIYGCLDRFCCIELMTGVNKYHCKYCTKRLGKLAENKSNNAGNVKKAEEDPLDGVFSQEIQDDDKKFTPVYTVSTAQMLICELPHVLVLNLKRFEHVGMSFRKITKHVTFPLHLDMLPFCTDDCKIRGSSNSTGLYDLFGIVVHSGRLGGGHYFAYVKARSKKSDLMSEIADSLENDTTSKLGDDLRKLKECSIAFKESDLCCQPGAWYYVSDTIVSKASESQALKSQAYILFYKRLSVTDESKSC